MARRLHPDPDHPGRQHRPRLRDHTVHARAVIEKLSGPSSRRRPASVINAAAMFFPTSTATTAAAGARAPLIDITPPPGVSGETRRGKRRILSGIRWIPSDTSGGACEEEQLRSYQLSGPALVRGRANCAVDNPRASHQGGVPNPSLGAGFMTRAPGAAPDAVRGGLLLARYRSIRSRPALRAGRRSACPRFAAGRDAAIR